MSYLSLVVSSEGPDTDSEGVLEGMDYPLIEPGIYEAVLVSWETSSRFSKKNSGRHESFGGREDISALPD